MVVKMERERHTKVLEFEYRQSDKVNPAAANSLNQVHLDSAS